LVIENRPSCELNTPVFRIALVLCVGVVSAFAHGDIHLQIIEVTKEIEKTPRNPELFVRRADLHRAHADWDAAQADYDHAFALNPKLTMIDLARARMFLEANWPLSSLTAVNRFLASHSEHPEGLIIRARALAKLNRNLEAAQNYTRALAKANEGRPELFLERAQALAAEGKEHVDEAQSSANDPTGHLEPADGL